MNVSFDEQRELCRNDPDKFWTDAAELLHWDKKWDTLLDNSDEPFSKWYVGGELNACYNCIDRHIENGLGDQIAIIYDSPVTETLQRITYSELKDQVSKLSGLLVSLGVEKGNVVAVYMPAIPEGPVSFLACARIGAIHNSIPGGLPAEDLALRIDHSQPKVMLTASHGFHPSGWTNYKQEVDKAFEICSHKIEKCVLLQREGKDPVNFNPSIDMDWRESVDDATPHDCVPVPSNEPLFILYTSGSTGRPKAIVHSVGSFIVRWALEYQNFIPDLNTPPMYAATSLGWVAGHMLVVYGPLLNGHTSFVYEGDHLLMTDPRQLYRLLSSNEIVYSMLRPGLLRAVKGMDPECLISEEFNFKLKRIFVGGEFIDDTILTWTYKAFGAQIYNIWAQTEIVAILSGVPSDLSECENKKYMIAGIPTTGLNVVSLNENQEPVETGEIGRLVVKLPLPPGGLMTLYKDDEMCKEIYFNAYPGYFDTKDEGFITEDGRVKIERRADDVIKAGPIYVASTAIERVIVQHIAVQEAVVVAQPHNIHRELPIAFVVLTTDHKDNLDETRQEIIEKVHDYFGRSMPFENVIFVEKFPRTRTGKVHKRSLVAMLRKLEAATGALDNPEVLSEIQEAIEKEGIV